MELWSIFMLFLSFLWILIFLLVIEMIKCENLCKYARRILRCRRSNQEESRDDIEVRFHRETDPENNPSVEFLSQNVLSESYKSHENTATWTSV